MTTRYNSLKQDLDISGSLNQNSSMSLIDEFNKLGETISGKLGTSASIVLGANIQVSGLTGFTSDSIGNFITIYNASNSNNNGTFLIKSINSSTSINIENSLGATDGNNGSISWQERKPYSLEDDINYIRTDRKNIKGTSTFYSDIPTYLRPNDLSTNIPANLTNLSGKTTDAKSFVITKNKVSAVNIGDGYITLSSTGDFHHANLINNLGVPISDGADALNYESTFVDFDQTGVLDGYQVFGRTRAGSSVSPNSVEIAFFKIAIGDTIDHGVPYTWNSDQPSSIKFYYPFRERLDVIDENSFRNSRPQSVNLTDVYNLIGATNSLDLYSNLTNKTNNFIFSSLSSTPSIVDIVNLINAEIGSRNYSGGILTSGQSITQSLQALSNASGGSSTGLRVNEIVTVDVPANTIRVLPGGNSYTPSANGQNMQIFVRGLLKQPGAIEDSASYMEIDSTHVKFYQSLTKGDVITYIIYM